MTITVNMSYRTSMKIFAQNKARRKFCKCKLLANALDEKYPSSLVLRYACKTFSKPSAYNQVLFHKTCRRVNFDLRVFFTKFANSQVFAILAEF